MSDHPSGSAIEIEKNKSCTVAQSQPICLCSKFFAFSTQNPYQNHQVETQEDHDTPPRRSAKACEQWRIEPGYLL